MQLIDLIVDLFAGFYPLLKTSVAPLVSARFQAVIIVGWTPKRWASSAVVSSFLKAVRATLALNAGVDRLRLLLMSAPFNLG